MEAESRCLLVWHVLHACEVMTHQRVLRACELLPLLAAVLRGGGGSSLPQSSSSCCYLPSDVLDGTVVGLDEIDVDLRGEFIGVADFILISEEEFTDGEFCAAEVKIQFDSCVVHSEVRHCDHLHPHGDFQVTQQALFTVVTDLHREALVEFLREVEELVDLEDLLYGVKLCRLQNATRHDNLRTILAEQPLQFVVLHGSRDSTDTFVPRLQTGSESFPRSFSESIGRLSSRFDVLEVSEWEESRILIDHH